MPKYAIWWLDQAAYELAEKLGAATASWPDYIHTEFKSRGGRAGRGRLWVSSEIKDFEDLTWREGVPEYDAVAKDCGGIVIRIEDVPYVVGWPGFVTDASLCLIHTRPTELTPAEVVKEDTLYPFVSRRAQLIYYLTQTGGESQCRHLGLEEPHYQSKALAKAWFTRLLDELGPRDFENAGAIDNLKELYAIVTHYDEEGEVEETQAKVVGDPRFKMVPWITDVYNRFADFITRLEESIEQMYHRGSWMHGPFASPSESLIESIINQILIAFAWEYLPVFNAVTPQWTSLGCGETKFVLITAQPALPWSKSQFTYPLGFDVIGNEDGLEKFYGPYESVLDRLYRLYGRSSTALAYCSFNLDPTVLIKLIIAELFTCMESGSNRQSHPAPPTRLCLAERAQDVKIDLRLAIGVDIILTPVIPEDESMFAAINRILGLDDEPEPKPKPNDKFKDISPATLSKKQKLKAEQLAQGKILSAYIELDRTFIIMEKDTKLPYVWIERPGFWRHIREGEDIWRYSKYPR